MRLLLDTVTGMPPTTLNKTGAPYSGSENFDSNMVIILAALLCALICALGLNSIVRCALRCSHRFETPEQATARRLATTTGLKKSALSQIPVVVYGSGMNVPVTDCPICLGEFADGDKVSSGDILSRSLFHKKFKYLKFEKRPIFVGISPLSSFLDTSKILRDLKILLEHGRIEPIRLLSTKSTSSSPKSNNPSAMLPLKLFPLNRITDSSVEYINDLGIFLVGAF